MRSDNTEPNGGILIDGFDPDLLEAMVPAVTGDGGPEALLALLRERADPRLNGIAELMRTECPWPVPAPSRGRVRLAAGRVGGCAWEIELGPPAWEPSWMCDQPDDWDFDDPGGDDLDHETDGGAFGGFGGSGFLDDEGDDRVIAPPRLDRADVEAGFASCKWQILLILLEVFPDRLLRWVTVVRGDITAAVHALRGVYDPDIQISDDPNLRWAARWLITIARLYPARHAALMAALWAVPRLHRAGYQVLGVTRLCVSG